MLYRTIIIDDDAFSASVLAHYCQKSEELLLVNQFTNPQKALAELGMQTLLANIRADLASLGVEYDEWYSERSLYADGTYEQAMALLQHLHKYVTPEVYGWMDQAIFILLI
mgnify:CR=1 FL=1